jgi:cysteine desulfurase
MIYLDYNATAPIRAQVREVVGELMEMPHNPSSVHRAGRTAKALIEKSRRTVAEALSCFPAEVIFTASGTEANNMALRGCGLMPMAVAATEHASVLKTVPQAVRLPVNEQGVLDLLALETFLNTHSHPACISVMLANNETGVIQPVNEIAQIVHRYGGILHCDAVQAFGKMPVDMTLLGVDMLSLSAHKLGGGQGAGALIVHQHLTIAPFITGGGQELNRRAGTENVAAIAGFAKAVEIGEAETSWRRQLRRWLDEMEAECSAMFPQTCLVLGLGVDRLPNTSCLRMPKVTSEVQLMQFDLRGIAISAGSACSSGRIEASHVVTEMLGELATDDFIRLSGGWKTTKEEIDIFTAIWKDLAMR